MPLLLSKAILSGLSAQERNLRRYTWTLSVLLFMVFLNYGCTAPQYIWPQRDVEFYEINRVTLEKKILIASRKSEFKNAIIMKVQDAFLEKPVYIRVIGVEDLKDEDARHYSAVLIMNTCMAWEIDRKVSAFIDQYGEMDSIIILTTSLGGDILPDMEGLQIDAISSASAKEHIGPIADEIISKIDAIIKASN